MTPLDVPSAATVIQDTVAARIHAPFEGVDSVVVESPLPGGVATVVRTLLDVVPWWVQIAGFILGVLVALAIVGIALRRRRAIAAWLASRSRSIKIGLAALVVILAVAGGGFGTAAWNYTQHDNGFCTGCHVMKPAYQEFVGFKDKHDTLACHDCHQQSVFASARQLYLWVAERPDEIRPHSKVPNAVCMTCHVVKGDTAVWQRIASTAGHRVHLESDSTALKDVQCVTCHGVEVHRFVPAPKTCGQTGCHVEDDTKIVLGKMAGQTGTHCVACHRFTADVPALATRDSAAGTLVPNNVQCLGCHEMAKVLADFEVGQEPHGGTCGTCHNPHTQKTPGAAITSCATAGCHADWREEPFHVGKEHRRGAEDCLTCHQPHRSKVDASDCESCHQAVRQRTAKRPPEPFDTLKALKRVSMNPRPPSPAEALRDSGDQPPEANPSGGFVWAGGFGFPTLLAQTDSFPHPRHRSLACLTCHTSRAGHGGLTFVPPRGCAICHHQAPATSKCESCHAAGQLAGAKALSAVVTVPGKPARPRLVDFAHAKHVEERRCVECHTGPVTMAVAAPAIECRSCHEDHHSVTRDCQACHKISDTREQHRETEVVHQRCDACHTGATVALLTPNRSFCATCHTAQREKHYEPRECVVCHFLTEPEKYRTRLLKPAGGQ